MPAEAPGPAASMRRGRIPIGALLACALAGCARQMPLEKLPNVVLITLESLRTDHVGAYGGKSRSRPDLALTPGLDALAREAVVYEDAHAVSSWTLAAHASLFTGLYPSGHQTDGPMDRLDDSYPTLAEVLAARGYQTAAVVSGPYLRRTHNLQQGFELYDDSIASLTSALAHDDVTNPRLEAALRYFVEEQRDASRPFFLFAYFWDSHFDFLPPAPYDEMFVDSGCEPIDLSDFDTSEVVHEGISPGQLAYVFSQYAGEVRWTDDHLARFFRLLKQHGLWDDTLVIVLGDHGEEFFDHGEKGHKNNLYAETVRIPLIVKFPKQTEGRRDARLVSQVDILSTILDVADTPVSFPVHGRSLREAVAGDRPIIFELRAVRYYRKDGGAPFLQGRRWYGARRGSFKLVWSEDDDAAGDAARAYQLFDVGVDPREQIDLAEEDPSRIAALSRSFEAEVDRARRDAARYRRGGRAQLSAEEMEQLRSLGYLER